MANVERADAETLSRVRLDEVAAIVPANVPVGAFARMFSDIVGEQGLAEILAVEAR